MDRTWQWTISDKQLLHLINGALYTHHQHGITLLARRAEDGVLITVTLDPVAPPPAATLGELAGD